MLFLGPAQMAGSVSTVFFCQEQNNLESFGWNSCSSPYGEGLAMGETFQSFAVFYAHFVDQEMALGLK